MVDACNAVRVRVSSDFFKPILSRLLVIGVTSPRSTYRGIRESHLLDRSNGMTGKLSNGITILRGAGCTSPNTIKRLLA